MKRIYEKTKKNENIQKNNYKLGQGPFNRNLTENVADYYNNYQQRNVGN